MNGKFALMLSAIFLVMALLSPAVAADGTSCLDQVKQALKQINASKAELNGLFSEEVRDWDGTTREAEEDVAFWNRTSGSGLNTGRARGVWIGNVFIYCVPNMRYSGEAQSIRDTDSGAPTSYHIVLNDDGYPLFRIKAILYHELIHVGLFAADGFGIFDRSGERYLGSIYSPQGGTGRPPIQPFPIHCHEAIAYGKETIYMQKLAKEFPDIEKDQWIEAWVDNFDDKAEKCHNIRLPSWSPEESAYWQRVMDNLKAVIADMVREHLLAKKIRAHKGLDSQIANLTAWLNISEEETKSTYKMAIQPIVRDGLARLELSQLPSQVRDLLKGEKLVLHVYSQQPGIYAEFGLAEATGRLELAEQPAPTAEIRILDRAMLNLPESKDTAAAVQTAIKDGELRFHYLDARGLADPFLQSAQSIFTIAAPAPEKPGSAVILGKKYLGEETGTNEIRILNKYMAPVAFTTRGVVELAKWKPEQLGPGAGLYGGHLEWTKEGEQ